MIFLKIKDFYSLRVDELLGDVPTADNFPVKVDDEISLNRVRQDYEGSLNIFEAFANYLVERNRTKDLNRQIETLETALDARNIEAKNQSKIIIDNYTERMKFFLETQRRELELEIQRIELKNAELVEGIRYERERQRSRITVLTKLLNFYLSSLEQIQKFLAETEESPELFVTKNKFRHQVKEDCRVKLKKINGLLKKIGNE